METRPAKPVTVPPADGPREPRSGVLVRVWFGEHVVAEYSAEQAEAARYAEAIGQRFAGLRVTRDPVAALLVAPSLPANRLWELTP